MTSFRQILDIEADKKLFEELCDETRAGVQMVADGRPLDKCFEPCTNKSEVVHLLQPLPAKFVDSNGANTSSSVTKKTFSLPSRSGQGKR